MATLLVVGALPAAAHVTVTGDDNSVQGGSNSVITFRVPTESDTASTISLRIALPTATPLASVQMLAMAGWTESQRSVALTTPVATDLGTITSAVSELTWTATAGFAISPGSFGEFSFISGVLPNASSLTFKAIQTYSDKKVVSWIQVPVAGQTADDVDYPAPILTLRPRGAANGDGAQSPNLTAAPATTRTAVLTIVAGVALVLAIAAIGGLVVVLRRLRRRPGDAPHAVTPAEAA